MFYMSEQDSNFERWYKYSEIKKKNRQQCYMMGDFLLGVFVYVYLICNTIGEEEAQTHLREVVLQP